MNGDKLESFYSCPNCDNEGFADEIDWNSDEYCCGECASADDDDDDDDSDEDDELVDDSDIELAPPTSTGTITVHLTPKDDTDANA